jgi:hypothetical protein
MWVTCDEEIDAAIPRWNDSIQLSAEPCRIGAAVNQHATTRHLHKNCVTLSNVKGGNS